jgi:hypothetical protein
MLERNLMQGSFSFSLCDNFPLFPMFKKYRKVLLSKVFRPFCRGPVVSNVQRSASASSTSVPWLAHLKSTSMSNVGRSISVMNNQSVLSPPATPTTPKAFEPPTPPYGFRPSISRPIQPSSAYLKYSAQIRWNFL